jgi:MFS family permease
MASPQIPYRIDYTSPLSLHNWVQQLNLICATETQIGMLGSVFFAGWTISAVIIPTQADKMGRKPVLLLTYIAVVVISIGIIFSSSITLTTIFLFFLGMTANGTCNVSFVLMIETTVPEWRSLTGSMLNVFGFA